MTAHSPRLLARVEIPHRVFDLSDPPRQLYLVGDLPRLPAIAVIGTRRPTEAAVAYTNELVYALAKQGVAIWSGGAEGIDATAHRAALQAGAPTVVVAPAGWDRPYPAQHAELYREVVQHDGGYLSLVPPDCSALPHQFFARNALLVALVQIVVIVQAGLRSGARNAAKFARRLGRPLFVAPSCPWVHQGLGCNAELALGARILNSPKDVLSAVSTFGLSSPLVPMSTTRSGDAVNGTHTGDTSQSSAVEPHHQTHRPHVHHKHSDLQSETELEVELSRIVAAVLAGAHSIDSLCEWTGLGLSVVQSDVLRLTLRGQLRTDQAGRIDLVTIGKH